MAFTQTRLPCPAGQGSSKTTERRWRVCCSYCATRHGGGDARFAQFARDADVASWTWLFVEWISHRTQQHSSTQQHTAAQQCRVALGVVEPPPCATKRRTGGLGLAHHHAPHTPSPLVVARSLSLSLSLSLTCIISDQILHVYEAEERTGASEEL